MPRIKGVGDIDWNLYQLRRTSWELRIDLDRPLWRFVERTEPQYDNTEFLIFQEGKYLGRNPSQRGDIPEEFNAKYAFAHEKDVRKVPDVVREIARRLSEDYSFAAIYVSAGDLYPNQITIRVATPFLPDRGTRYMEALADKMTKWAREFKQRKRKAA